MYCLNAHVHDFPILSNVALSVNLLLITVVTKSNGEEDRGNGTLAIIITNIHQ